MASEAQVQTGESGINWSFGNGASAERANEAKPFSSDSTHQANDVAKSSGDGPTAVTISHSEVPAPSPSEPPVKATPGLTFASAGDAEAVKPADAPAKVEEPAKAAPATVTISTNGNGSGGLGVEIGAGKAKSKSKSPAPPPAVTVAVVTEKKEEAPAPEAPVVEKKDGISAVTVQTATANGSEAKKPGRKPGKKAEGGAVVKKAERPKKRAATETGEPRRSKRNKV